MCIQTFSKCFGIGSRIWERAVFRCSLQESLFHQNLNLGLWWPSNFSKNKYGLFLFSQKNQRKCKWKSKGELQLLAQNQVTGSECFAGAFCSFLCIAWSWRCLLSRRRTVDKRSERIWSPMNKTGVKAETAFLFYFIPQVFAGVCSLLWKLLDKDLNF